jgi:hypothetical protein
MGQEGMGVTHIQGWICAMPRDGRLPLLLWTSKAEHQLSSKYIDNPAEQPPHCPGCCLPAPSLLLIPCFFSDHTL